MSAANGTCPVAGNGDLYGLGIRLALYMQMVTVQLSGQLSAYFRVEDHIGESTIVLVLSTLVVLVRLVAASSGGGGGGGGGIGGDAALEPVEVFPVLTLLVVQVGVCRVSSHGRLVMLIWMAELVGLAALNNYFWWRGMDLLPRSCPDDKAFFFARVSIWGWFRSLNKASAVVVALGVGVFALMYCGASLYVLVWTAIGCCRRRLRRRPGDDDDDDDHHHHHHHQQQDQQHQQQQQHQDAPQERSRALGTIDLFANVGAIVYVEVSLKWNGITGVHSLDSPGQFMPFFIALGQLLSVFYSAAKYLLQLYADEHALDHDDDSTLECRHDEKTRRGPRAADGDEGLVP